MEASEDRSDGQRRVSGWATALDDLRRGDTATIERLERLIAHCLASLGLHALHDSWEDVSQDVLVALLKRPVDCETRFVPAYVRATTLHTYIDHVRRERGRKRPETRHEGVSAWRRRVPLDEAGERRSDEPRGQCLVDSGIAEALSRLADKQHRAIACKYLLGQSNQEAACTLGETLPSYRRLVSRGIESLRRELALGPVRGWQADPQAAAENERPTG